MSTGVKGKEKITDLSDLSSRDPKVLFEFFSKCDYIPTTVLDDYFSMLEPIKIEAIWGDWQGGYFFTGNKLARLLEVPHLIWKGKRFTDYDDVKALVYDLFGNELLPIIGNAYVRMKEFRGKVSAAMTYKYLPVTDYFRKIDDQTLMGVMDAKIPGVDWLYFYIYR